MKRPRPRRWWRNHLAALYDLAGTIRARDTGRAFGLTASQTNEVIGYWQVEYDIRHQAVDWIEVREAIKRRACDMEWRP